MASTLCGDWLTAPMKIEPEVQQTPSHDPGASNSGRAVFLDRDGVLSVEGGDYVCDPDELRLLPGSVEAVVRLYRAGWSVIVFTNQAGVGKGYLTLETLDAIHKRLEREISAAGGALTAIYACPHHPDDGCDCRKPKPGMLLRGAMEQGLTLSRCFVVGDTPRDLAAGKAVGCTTLLVLSGHTHSYDASIFPDPQPDLVFSDLAEAADWLLENGTLN